MMNKLSVKSLQPIGRDIKEIPKKKEPKKPPLGIYRETTVLWFKDPIHPNEEHIVLNMQIQFDKVLIESKISKVKRWVNINHIKNN